MKDFQGETGCCEINMERAKHALLHPGTNMELNWNILFLSTICFSPGASFFEVCQGLEMFEACQHMNAMQSQPLYKG